MRFRSRTAARSRCPAATHDTCRASWCALQVRQQYPPGRGTNSSNDTTTTNTNTNTNTNTSSSSSSSSTTTTTIKTLLPPEPHRAAHT